MSPVSLIWKIQTYAHTRLLQILENGYLPGSSSKQFMFLNLFLSIIASLSLFQTYAQTLVFFIIYLFLVVGSDGGMRKINEDKTKVSDANQCERLRIISTQKQHCFTTLTSASSSVLFIFGCRYGTCTFLKHFFVVINKSCMFFKVCCC